MLITALLKGLAPSYSGCSANEQFCNASCLSDSRMRFAAKMQLAEEITKDVMIVLGYGAESVSVAFEEFGPDDWKEKSTRPIS